VNGDGKLDALTVGGGGSSFSHGTVSVLLGAGAGKLSAHVEYAVGANPQGLAVGDLDGDGKLDLAVANLGYDGGWSLGVLIGKGDGTFAPEVELESAYGPNSIALGDLNGDGKLDIVAANSGAATTVSVSLGKGDGTFAAHVDYVTGERPHSVVLGDMNGDGKLDAVTANPDSHTVSVLPGKGDGTFAPELQYIVNATMVALGDVNRDGTLDVVTDKAVLASSCR
jgi:hypothetical protein